MKITSLVWYLSHCAVSMGLLPRVPNTHLSECIVFFTENLINFSKQYTVHLNVTVFKMLLAVGTLTVYNFWICFMHLKQLGGGTILIIMWLIPLFWLILNMPEICLAILCATPTLTCRQVIPVFFIVGATHGFITQSMLASFNVSDQPGGIVPFVTALVLSHSTEAHHIPAMSDNLSWQPPLIRGVGGS